MCLEWLHIIRFCHCHVLNTMIYYPTFQIVFDNKLSTVKCTNFRRDFFEPNKVHLT